MGVGAGAYGTHRDSLTRGDDKKEPRPEPGFWTCGAIDDQQPGNLKSWMRVCQPPLGRYMPTNQKVQSSTGSTVIW